MSLKLEKNSPFTTPVRIKILLILLILCFALLILNKNGIISLFKEKQIQQTLVEEKLLLEQSQNSLKEEKEKLLNDKQHIEKIAREQYNMVFPGETVYKVIEE
ncbi:MAG: septum formation initiator family protein [Candidatus Neomarinimicrobiota bacterium]|jgi:cell division protein FtsB|nr:septum formation initiator family protein [Candidatus Neomarinimicrobiota bacterium]MDD3965836.1 septum formation initiator family protein [Candidatus Neomarinimicrobiota bacterium]MDX9779709.1 septum formation initiator family protein [bacterium]